MCSRCHGSRLGTFIPATDVELYAGMDVVPGLWTVCPDCYTGGTTIHHTVGLHG